MQANQRRVTLVVVILRGLNRNCAIAAPLESIWRSGCRRPEELPSVEYILTYRCNTSIEALCPGRGAEIGRG